MTRQSSPYSLDSFDMLETVDDLEPISSSDMIEVFPSETLELPAPELDAKTMELDARTIELPTSDDTVELESETVEVVHSSELMEPLEADDMIGLDYDEDLPTRVDGKRRRTGCESVFPPARVDEGDDEDIYYLTSDRAVPAMDESPVDIREVLFSPPVSRVELPSARDTIPPVGSAPSKMSSIAPVVTSNESGAVQAVVPRRAPVAYGAAIGFLAAAAAAILLWPTEGGRGHDLQPAAQVIQTTEARIEADIPEPVTLPEVPIVGERPKRSFEDGAGLAMPAQPGSEVVIDDSVQLNGAVFPSASHEPGKDSTEAESGANLEPPAPPSVEHGPFDASAAASAMNAAAGAAQACRVEGMPRAMARVSVTFAPSGRVTTAMVDGARFAGNPAAGCVARTFRNARVNPFSGPPVTVHKTFQF